MSIGEHLEELRRRIFYSLVSFFVVFCGVFAFHDPVRDWAMRPLHIAMANLRAKNDAAASKPGAPAIPVKTLRVVAGPPLVVETSAPDGTRGTGRITPPFELVIEDPVLVDSRPTVLSPQEGVFQDLKLATLLALLFAAPLLLFQLWAFIRAGLYESERRAIGPYLPMIILLFLAGAAFGYFIMLPFILTELVNWLPSEKINIQNRLQEYLQLFYTFTFWLGMIFEVPVIMMVLSRVGIVSAAGFLKAWRWAILGGIVAGAVLNPAPDILSQLLFAAPIVGLYMLGCGMAWLGERSRRRAAAARN